jgi:hypothetical protein
MTSFYLASFICSSVYATLTIFTVTSTLALACYIYSTSVLVTVKIGKIQITSMHAVQWSSCSEVVYVPADAINKAHACSVLLTFAVVNSM